MALAVILDSSFFFFYNRLPDALLSLQVRSQLKLLESVVLWHFGSLR